MSTHGTSRLFGTALMVALALAMGMVLEGCGGDEQEEYGARQRTGRPATSSSVQPAAVPVGPAFGLTEDNADLLWNPDGTSQPPAQFRAAQEALTALHPSYLRVLIDWAALQPSPAQPANLEGQVSGCDRGVGPCGAYAGIRDEFAAIASQQRADREAGGEGAFQIVIDIFGAPAWAVLGPSGCELPGAGAFSRPLSATGLQGYRALIGELLALGSQEGVALAWWSPWNEPNDPIFLGPQRAACTAGSRPLSPLTYASLARAMASELRAHGGEHHMILGELDDLEVGSPHATSVAQFVAALPAAVVCLSEVWSIHAYATYGVAGAPSNAVGTLEAALDARGKCGREAQIWVTEAGAGAPHAGRPRPVGNADERAGCRALAAQLMAWYGDPRVGAVFQYTFREDPDFPVGLVNADLSHFYPTYELWLTWSRALASGEPSPSPPAACT